MKILSNVLGIELCIPETEEGPSLGAAFLAAAAHTGDIKSFTSKTPKIRERILPDAEISSRYEEKFRRYTKIYPNMKNLFKEMREN
jgi:xylulokinase